MESCYHMATDMIDIQAAKKSMRVPPSTSGSDPFGLAFRNCTANRTPPCPRYQTTTQATRFSSGRSLNPGLRRGLITRLATGWMFR